MYKKYLLGLLAVMSVVNSAQGSYLNVCESAIGNIEYTIGQFSLILFSLEKNVLSIERYPLQELAQDITRLSKKDCADHCLYRLHLAEKGQRVACIDWDPTTVGKLTVSTYRANQNINYSLDWGSLVTTADPQLQDCMKASVQIQQVSNGATVAGARDRKVQWYTSLAIKWGMDEYSLDINLTLERKIQSVACAIIPNSSIDESNNFGVDLTKQELINAGVLTVSCSDASTQPSNLAACTDQTPDCSDCPCQQTWYSLLYYAIAAKLDALTTAVCSCCGYC